MEQAQTDGLMDGCLYLGISTLHAWSSKLDMCYPTLCHPYHVVFSPVTPPCPCLMFLASGQHLVSFFYCYKAPMP